MPRCLIGLGSNVGDRAAQLDFAVRRLKEHPRIEFIARSRWIETAPVGGPGGQAAYLNGAALIKTPLPPEAVLDFLQQIEDEAGRRRDVRWGPRTLDLDVLLYGRRALQSPRLTIPHPRMALRRFVLEPAAEVAGDMVHPTIGWKVHRLWRHLLDARRTVALGGPPSADKARLATVLCDRLPATLVAGHEEELVARLAGSSPVRARDVAIEFFKQWRELREPSGIAQADTSWRVRDFAIADVEALIRLHWGERAGFCRWELKIFDDALGAPRLTLIVQTRGATDAELAVVKNVALLAEGPTLTLDASHWEFAVAEAIAAVRSAE